MSHLIHLLLIQMLLQVFLQPVVAINIEAQVGDRITVTTSDGTPIPLPATIVAISKNKYTIEMLPSFQYKGGEKYIVSPRQIKAIFPAEKPVIENDKDKDKDRNSEQSSKKKPLQGSASSGDKAKTLSGLYIGFGQRFEGKKLVCSQEQYYFFPDGRVYRGLPPHGPAHLNWSEAQQSSPALCGSYGISGNTIIFKWPSETLNWSIKRRGNTLELNGMVTDQAPAFGKESVLSGTYGRDQIIVTNGKPSTSPVRYSFSKDGKVTFEEAGKRLTGTYKLSGNDLSLGFEPAQSYTIYAQHLDNRNQHSPDRISIDGKLYQKL